jgi:hypothetical protein
MKNNSYARIFVLTFLFFSFSAIAQDIYAVNLTGRVAPNSIFRWAAAHPLGASRIQIVSHAKAHETKSALATLCTRKYAGEKAD